MLSTSRCSFIRILDTYSVAELDSRYSLLSQFTFLSTKVLFWLPEQFAIALILSFAVISWVDWFLLCSLNLRTESHIFPDTPSTRYMCFAKNSIPINVNANIETRKQFFMSQQTYNLCPLQQSNVNVCAQLTSKTTSKGIAHLINTN